MDDAEGAEPTYFTTPCKAVFALGNTAYALTTGNQLYAWGYGRGESWSDASGKNYVPRLFTSSFAFSNVRKFADGAENHIVALLNDGTVWGYGENSSGQLGIGNTTNQSTFKQMLSGGVLTPHPHTYVSNIIDLYGDPSASS